MIWIAQLSTGGQTNKIDSPGSQDHFQDPTSPAMVSEPRGGGATIAPRLVTVCLDLTARQVECLAWVAEGKSAIEIGMILGISARTVEKHIARACEIFGVNRRIQAVDQARRLGLIAAD
jgi:DNA-binding CsgD family transcriptional regulator